MIEFPPYRLDARAGRLWRGDQAVPLRPKAWSLLCYLAERKGTLVTKGEIHAAVWGDTVVSDDTLTRTLAELRHALQDDARLPRVIETVHRRGFRFIAPTADPSAGGLAPAPAAAQGPPPASAGSALVGRDAEFARLWAQFREAAAGRRQVVFVQGEAGIGKSALVAQFLQLLQRGPEPVAVGYGQCVEQFGEREPYMAVLEILERLSQGAASSAVVGALRSVAPSWLAQLPGLQRPTDAERLRRWHAETTPLRMLREFSGLIEAVSGEHPVVLVLEDLHWSDQATVDLVSVLAQRTERARLMLVGTYRPAQAAALDHPIQVVLTMLRTQGRCAEIPLEYLSRRDVAAYLARRFPGAGVADEVVTAVHARTDGNPMFMIVLVDHLLARGWLAQDGGRWHLTVARTAIEQDVPDNLRQLIEGQLRFASADERDVLEVASVAGVAFDAPAVAVGVDGPADTVESICHRLSRAHRWLQEAGTRHWPDGAVASRYAFQHALYQRTLYERLAPGRRAALHERIGQRLEAAYAGRSGEAAAELARHFQFGQDRGRALIYLEQAAVQAYERRAFADVVACLDPALRLLHDAPDTPDRARIELRLRGLYTTVLSQTGGYTTEPLLDNLRRSRALCGELGDAAALFDVLTALFLLHAQGGQPRLAEELGIELSELCAQLDASAALQYHAVRGAAAVWFGSLVDAESLLARALASPVSLEAADRPYGVNPVVAARSFEGLRRWVAGDAAGAHAVQKEAMALAAQQRRSFTVAQATAFSAMVLALDGDMAEARRRAAQVIALAEEYGFPRWRGRALVIHGRALVEEAQGAQGLAEIREGLDGLRRSGLRLGSSVLLSMYAQACLRTRQLDEGLAAVQAGLEHCRETTERLFEPELWRLRAEILSRRGRGRGPSRRRGADDAEACRDRALTMARARGAQMLARRAGDAPPRRARRGA